ncbi:MAG: hypothetical protein ACPG7F_17380 [Aggregatilineales bacterium]
MKKLIILAVLAFFLIPVFAQNNSDLPAEIVAEYERLHPEGIEYDAAGERFLVGSLTLGTIFAIADDGTVTPFIEDEDFGATTGIHIDTINNRLLVASTDSLAQVVPLVPGFANLGIYDLETGARIHLVDASASYPGSRYFANDVTSDPDGNAYLTDSLSPVIYKITLDGDASVLIEDERFSSDEIGLNGIEFHPDGYLIVAVGGTSKLYKVPLDDPEMLSEIILPEPIGSDGLNWHPDGYLIAVATTFNEDGEGTREILKLRSDDDWQSANIFARGSAINEFSPTTAAIRDGEVYVVHARFGDLFGAGAAEFPIVRVNFEVSG